MNLYGSFTDNPSSRSRESSGTISVQEDMWENTLRQLARQGMLQSDLLYSYSTLFWVALLNTGEDCVPLIFDHSVSVGSMAVV